MGECGSKADTGRTEGHCKVPLMVLWIRMVGQMGYVHKCMIWEVKLTGLG